MKTIKIAMCLLALALCLGCSDRRAQCTVQLAFPQCRVSKIPSTEHLFLAFDGTNVWLVESWGLNNTGDETVNAVRNESVRMFGNGP